MFVYLKKIYFINQVYCSEFISNQSIGVPRFLLQNLKWNVEWVIFCVLVPIKKHFIYWLTEIRFPLIKYQYYLHTYQKVQLCLQFQYS